MVAVFLGTIHKFDKYSEKVYIMNGVKQSLELQMCKNYVDSNMTSMSQLRR